MLRESFDQHIQVVERAIPIVLPVLEQAVDITVDRLRRGGKILAFGNGGSAAQAQHFAAEITGRFAIERPGLPAVALSSDPVLLTAVANDLGFEHVFERQIEALIQARDVAVAISTSGRSANVVAAAGAARQRGAYVIGLTGPAECALRGACDLVIPVPSEEVARIQEVHTICLHAWAGAVEATLSHAEPAP